MLSAAVLLSCRGGDLFERLPDLPDPLGRSGLYAAESGGVLYVAGGCNFPDKPVYEGGVKVFYDDIWSIELDGGEWRMAGRLPRGSAYGASFVLGGRMVVAGGADGSGAFTSVLSVGMDGTVEALAELPVPVQQAAACTCGDRAYLVGGLSSEPDYAGVLLMEGGSFVEYCVLPEPMVQPLSFHDGHFLYVWGGFNPLTKRALDYGYRYDGDHWEKIGGFAPDETLTGAAGILSGGRFYVVGGVDKAVMDNALSLSGQAVKEYQRHERSWYRFRDNLRVYDPGKGLWMTGPGDGRLAKAGAAIVVTSDGSVISIGGEALPGVRSAEIMRIKVNNIDF